jgi:cellulose synthase/poly-beta-1,6-N-acetylglucosamine synthase-like glycosyltransferase
MKPSDKLKGIDPLQLAHERPEMSACVPMTRTQKILMYATLLLAVAGSIVSPWHMARGFVFCSTVFYLVFTLYKLMLVRMSVVSDSQIHISKKEIASVIDDDLPIYSVLVPMYLEPESLAQIVESLDKMDDPADKKDVQFLLEEDDEETLKEAELVSMPQGFSVTVVPESHPRTKPKACNFGLELAKGEYLVVYDAEDRPEPDQLKKAVLAFRQVAENVVCLQSKLNFYNPRQNLLTRWFTAEYSAWFDLSLPGLSAIGAVMPLGGTSNHFVTSVLKEMMGWDAYNVTEDCDLGVRIHRMGYRTRMLDSSTWEEACSSFPYWIKQRTRWLKGYIQTYLVHMRHPVLLLRELGVWNFLNFQLLIAGIIISFLINPIFWTLALLWFFLRLEILVTLFPGVVFAMGAVCLFAGNFVFAYTCALGCYKRGYYDLVKYAVLSPIYWLFMSYSGWRAFLQFFTNPFYWEKTKHGLNTEK